MLPAHSKSWCIPNDRLYVWNTSSGRRAAGYLFSVLMMFVYGCASLGLVQPPLWLLIHECASVVLDIQSSTQVCQQANLFTLSAKCLHMQFTVPIEWRSKQIHDIFLQYHMFFVFIWHPEALSYDTI